MNVTTALRIASVNTETVLSLDMAGAESATVSIEGAFARGNVQVWLYDGSQSLVDFFRSMAADWHGWLGSKTWRSLEGECAFDATTDRAGRPPSHESRNGADLGMVATIVVVGWGVPSNGLQPTKARPMRPNDRLAIAAPQV